jgi:hypothetical protein
VKKLAAQGNPIFVDERDNGGIQPRAIESFVLQIRYSTGIYPTRHHFRSVTIVLCYALHGSYGNPELDGVGSQNKQTRDRRQEAGSKTFQT